LGDGDYLGALHRLWRAAQNHRPLKRARRNFGILGAILPKNRTLPAIIEREAAPPGRRFWEWVRGISQEQSMGWRGIWDGLLAVALVLLWVNPGNAAILSSKRGFADTGAGYSNLQATGAGWYYTWGLGDGNPGNFDAEFAPMFWGSWAVNQGNIDAVKNNANVEWVLGFNEPERPDQANLTVTQAISHWTTLSNGFAGSGKKLVSPAVADTGGATGGQQWLANFMTQAAANNLQVDAVAFHWYGVSTPDNPAGAASSFLSRVQSYYNSYQKPVFITEFAIHDWGGNYSDAAIIEANRQFLDIVIPELESRSYVAGYSWYHWFNDAHLYEGSPPTPTPMGQTYVGALKSGAVENIGGRDLGEHVAYLAGGELTATGSAPTNFNYINALSSTSSVSGSVDWRLSSGDWVRIQSGATLRKTGPNEIGFVQDVRGNLPTITNSGVLEVSQGRLYSEAPIGGTGTAVVKGGTLALALGANLNQTPLVDVRSGGTFDVSGLANGYVMPRNQMLKVATGGTVVGNVTVANGSIASGGGTFNGNLSAGTGALVRVGDDGTGVPNRHIVDSFESYALGNVTSTASPPWTPHQATEFADIETASGNKVLTYGWAGGARGVSRTLPEPTILQNDETATFFFRINSKTNDPDHNVGLADQASTTTANFGDFEAQLRMSQGAGSTFNLDARNGGAFSSVLASGLALNSWYNIWMVVNQTTDRYDIYMNTGTDAATAGNKLNATPLAFRNGTSSDLNTFLAMSNTAPIDNGVRVDDIYFFDGVDLSNPTGGFDPGLTWNPELLTITGDYTPGSGATLEMNTFDASNHDVLDVGGTASLAGTLRVTLATGATAPQEGDAFDLLDFASASGGFNAFDLPTLDAGLMWDTSDLVTTGVLAVVAALPGDFDFDGDVDGRDFLAWQRDPNVGDLADWQANYGVGLGLLTAAEAASPVPEPAGVVLMGILSIVACCPRWPRVYARQNLAITRG
jgi:hypothetical protein